MVLPFAMPTSKPLNARTAIWSFHRLVFLALLITGLLLGAIPERGNKSAAARAAQDKAAKPFQEYFQSLKSQPEDRFGFKLIVPDAAQHVRFEPEGIRLVLPEGHAGARPNCGFSTGIGLQGDFEITLAFEIFKEPEKAMEGTTGAKWHLFLTKDIPPFDLIGFSRHITPWGGPRFTTWFNNRDPVSGKNKQSFKSFPLQVKKGQMRLVRSGRVLSYSLAEDPQRSFSKLQEFSFGEEDVKDLRFVASTEGPEDVVDVRFSDLSVRAEALFNVPETNTSQANEESWLFVPLAIVLLVVLLIVVGFATQLLSHHKNHRTEMSPDTAWFRE